MMVYEGTQREQVMKEILLLQEALKSETKILERISIRILICWLNLRVNRKIRISTDILTSIVAFLALIFAPLGFLLYTIIFHICMQMEGVYYELNLDDTTGFFFFLIQITIVYLIGYYTSAYVFIATYIVVHICIILLKEVAVFGFFSS